MADLRRGRLTPRHFFEALTIVEEAGSDGLHRYALSDGRHGGYVVSAGLRIHRR